jgi:hypothetical protein
VRLGDPGVGRVACAHVQAGEASRRRVVPEGPRPGAGLGDLVPERALPDLSRDHLDRVTQGVPEAEVRPPATAVDGDEQDQVVEPRDLAAPHVARPALHRESQGTQHDLERAVMVKAVARVAARRDPLEGLPRVRRVGPPEQGREVLVRHRVQVPPLQLDQARHRRPGLRGEPEPGQVLVYLVGPHAVVIIFGER